MVQEWCKAKAQFEEQLQRAGPGGKRKKGAGRPLKYPAIEQQLLGWFRARRQKKTRVTGKSLKYEALRLHRLHGNQNFRASRMWFDRFKKRHK